MLEHQHGRIAATREVYSGRRIVGFVVVCEQRRLVDSVVGPTLLLVGILRDPQQRIVVDADLEGVANEG